MASEPSDDLGLSSNNNEAAPIPTTPTGDSAVPGVQSPIDYQALFEAVKDKPCRVAKVNKHVEGRNGGMARTRAELLERELEPIQRAQSLSELHTEMEAAGQRLKQLGIFNSVEMLAHEEPLDDPSACTVDVHLEESNWWRLRAATTVHGGESTLEVTAGLNNAAGGAEKLEANFEYGAQSSHLASLAFTQPRVMGSGQQFEARASQVYRSNQKASSFTEQLRGVVLGLRSMDGAQAVEYELGWRQLLDTEKTASRAVRAQLGDYLKSALRYTSILDRREPAVGGAAASLGGAGWAVKSTTEVAGLLPPQHLAAAAAAGGKALYGAASAASSAAASDVSPRLERYSASASSAPAPAASSVSPSVGSTLRFVRQQVDAVANVPMDDTGAVVFSLGASAGVLLPWGDGDPLGRPTCIADRFFLGGPSTLRGFKFKGVGPTDLRRPPPGQQQETSPPKRDALGGDLYTSVFASLMFQLPHPVLQYLRLHGHAFVNGGNVVQLAGTGRSPKQVLSEFGSTFRWSCGAGLVLPTPLGRFEANYCVLLAGQEHDRVRRGLQLGFAASPL